MLQQHAFKSRFCSLLLAKRLLHFPFSQLKSRTVRGRRRRCRRQNLARRGQVVHPEQHVGLEYRRLVVEDAFRIAIGKSVQNVLRSGIVAGCMAGLGVEKVHVVAQLSVGAASLRQRGLGLCIAFIQQIRVSQRQVSRRRSLARVAVRVGRHTGIRCRRAQGGKLLRHRLQLF